MAKRTGDAIDRPIPYNIEAEQAVLGSILIDPDKIDVIRDTLTPADFYREAHQWVCEAAYRLRDRREPIDTLTIVDELERAGRLSEAGGPSAVTALFLAVPTAIHAEHYAAMVVAASIQRQTVQAAEQWARAAYDGMAPDELVAYGQARLYKLMQRLVSRETHSVADVAPRVLSQIIERVELGITPGVPTLSGQLNTILGGGWEIGTLNIIAAPPGMGKTAFLLANAAHAAKLTGRPVLINSLEMGTDELTERLIAAEAGIDSRLLRLGPGRVMDRDEFFERVTAAAETVKRLPIEFTYQATAVGLRARALSLAAQRGPLAFVAVDYLQIMTHGEGRDYNRAQAIGQTTRQLKMLAVDELRCPVLALSQLNNEGKKSAEATMADLRDSGVISEDADVVMILSQEKSDDPRYPKPLRCKVDKHRSGPVGDAWLTFDRPTGRFEDARPQPQEPPARRRRNGREPAWGPDVDDVDF